MDDFRRWYARERALLRQLSIAIGSAGSLVGIACERPPAHDSSTGLESHASSERESETVNDSDTTHSSSSESDAAESHSSGDDTSESEASGHEGDDDDGSIKFDIEGLPDFDPHDKVPAECLALFDDLELSGGMDVEDHDCQDVPAHHWVLNYCFKGMKPNVTCDDIPLECMRSIIFAESIGKHICAVEHLWKVCDLIPQSGACCIDGHIEPQQSCPGRPLLIHGRCRLALASNTRQWQHGDTRIWSEIAHELCIESLDDGSRRKFAQAWRRDALHEHAAVASFTRFAMQLLAAAAPPELVRAALEAADDEISHAQFACTMAALYEPDVSFSPGELDIRGALEDGRDRNTWVLATVREGCIAETVSLLQLELAIARCPHGQLREQLVALSQQEYRHVELAWRSVAWALDYGDISLRHAVQALFERAEDYLAEYVAFEGIDPMLARRHGRLSSRTAAQVAHRALRALIRPCSEALLRGSVRTCQDDAKTPAGKTSLEHV